MLAYDRSSTGLWVALIFLVSLNLRPAIAAVGPVLAQMGTDLAWGEGVQGVLTAIPLIAFAAVSPLVTFLARRIGIDMSILLALLCIAAVYAGLDQPEFVELVVKEAYAAKAKKVIVEWSQIGLYGRYIYWIRCWWSR